MPQGRTLGLLTATGVSGAANAMVAVLVPWLVLERTGSAAQAGLVGAVSLAAAVPALLLGGPIIDRWGRRRVSVAADMLSAGSVAALPLMDLVVGLTLVSTLALVALGALFDGPGAAAREAARPEVAAAAGASLDRLNARGEAMDGLGQVAGPALAGAGLAAVGALSSLWVAAGLFLLAAAATRFGLPVDPAGTGSREPFRRSAWTGLRLVATDPVLRATAVLGTVALAFLAPLTLVLTAHLAPRDQPGTLGLVTAALAVGAVIGALGYGAVADRLSRRTGLIAGLAGTTLGLAALALLPGPLGLTVLAGLTGFAVGPLNPIAAVVLQDRTPAVLRGRVISTVWSLSLLASPLGLLGAGLLLEASSPAVTLLVIAAGLAVTTAYAALTPGLRHIERRHLE